MEQGHLDESEAVFRKDLIYHPKNPWALVGLINCLKKKIGDGSCCVNSDPTSEITRLERELKEQRKAEWADYDVKVACACCTVEC